MELADKIMEAAYALRAADAGTLLVAADLHVYKKTKTSRWFPHTKQRRIAYTPYGKPYNADAESSIGLARKIGDKPWVLL